MRGGGKEEGERMGRVTFVDWVGQANINGSKTLRFERGKKLMIYDV
jgi:hypothetical protein